jgi:two-component system CheB/CheR fusion protein
MASYAPPDAAPATAEDMSGGSIAPRKPTPNNGLIVGIGASAGGLEAFKTFFAQVPADTDLAFVLVQHLAPDHTRLLAELLVRVTRIPVVEAVDGARVDSGHVYVIPANATLTIRDRVWRYVGQRRRGSIVGRSIRSSLFSRRIKAIARCLWCWRVPAATVRKVCSR